MSTAALVYPRRRDLDTILAHLTLFHPWTLFFYFFKVRFIRRISAVSNAIEKMDNEMICFIIFSLNCIRHGRNATYEPGLTAIETFQLYVGRTLYLHGFVCMPIPISIAVRQSVYEIFLANMPWAIFRLISGQRSLSLLFSPQSLWEKYTYFSIECTTARGNPLWRIRPPSPFVISFRYEVKLHSYGWGHLILSRHRKTIPYSSIFILFYFFIQTFL